MLDQDTTRALLTVADECQVRVALLGDLAMRSGEAPGAVFDALLARGQLRLHPDAAPLGHVYYGHNLIGRAVSEAGLPKGTTSHDLRHHYASVLLAGGESVVAVAERLGHEDASLVLSTYGHLMPDSDDRTRSAIDAAWDAARASCALDVPQDVESVR
jgi:integrase